MSKVLPWPEGCPWKWVECPEYGLIALAALIGIASGLAARFLEWGIGLLSVRSERLAVALPAWSAAFTVLLPAAGGLLVGLLSYHLYRSRHPEEVGEVIEGVALHGGNLPSGRLLLRGFSSTLTIGSGGSAGPEGPVILIGSGLGALIGRRLAASQDLVTALVAGGAAAGIAAAFNAPLAGVIFASEVILGEFSVRAFSLVVVSAVASSAVVQQFLGAGPLLETPLYTLGSATELVFYLLLGLVCALVARLFVAALEGSSAFFEQLRVPTYVKPALGGLLVGVLTLALPQVKGIGWPALKEIAHPGNEMALGLLLAVGAGKLLATSLTLGSRGAGGVLAPLLLVGAALGGAAGTVLHNLYPDLIGSPGAYALAGAGGTLASAAQAPIAGIILLFELTRNYRLMLPFMLTCVVASLVGAAWSRKTIYNLSFLRRGIELRWGKDIGILRTIPVSAAMTREVATIKQEATVREVVALMQRTNHTGFPVVDEVGELCGIITLQDVRRLPLEGRLDQPVRAAMTQEVAVAYPDENLAEVSQRLGVRHIGRLPVVSHQNPRRLVGVLTRSDIINAYNRFLAVSVPATAVETGYSKT